MKMRYSSLLMLAVGGLAFWGAGARADFTITYLATGTFMSSSTPTSTSGDSTVTYTDTGVQSVTVPPSSQVSLGTFTTASTSATPQAFSDTFTLSILILSAGPGSGDTFTFTGVLTGTVSSSTATGHLVFSPLSETMDGLTISIASFDSGVPGAVNLGAPTTDGGTTTLNGAINVPEPSSVILLGMGGSALVGLVFRRRLGQAARIRTAA